MTPSSTAPDAPATERAFGRRGRTWRTAAWLIVVVGLLGSLVGATQWRSSLEHQSQEAFDTSATDVVAQVDSSLERAMDLTTTAGTTLELDPSMTNAKLLLWSANIEADNRHPESLGFSYVAQVPAAGLAAYQASAAKDPNPGSTVFDPKAILPAGDRAEYCFTRLVHFQGPVSMIENSAPSVMAQTDWCATTESVSLKAATDSGKPVVVGAPVLFDSLYTTISKALGLDPSAPSPEVVQWKAAMARSVFVFDPLYRNGAIITTVAARREASIGWAAAAFNVGQVVDQAVGGRKSLALTLSRPGTHDPIATVVPAATGHGPKHSLTQTINQDGGWTVTVAGRLDDGGLTPFAQSGLGFLGGLVLTLMLFTLVRVLSSARTKALELVDERTGELRHQALHDALTGLPNRALVLDRAEQMLARSRREQTSVAVLFVDLDNFKDINDSLGHAAGDELLIAVAHRFRAALRQTDTVGRLGGDEFVVVADGESVRGGPGLVAERLLDVLQEPFLLTGSDTPRTVTASIGVAAGQADAQKLLRDADIALYEAKYAGKSCFVQFEDRMHDDVDTRIRLDGELRGALDAHQFRLFYQPTFGIHDTATTGVEALIRWDHPTRGLLLPGEFLPLLEDNGMIVPIGRWVLHEACRQGELWHSQGHEIVMSVNASARQMTANTLYTDVRDALAASGFNPTHLVVEITEGTLMQDSESAVAQLKAIKDLGVRVAIDDFGTGYSSLAYLRQFPVDILKIDRSFITDLTHSHDSLAVVHALIQLGKTLGLETVAEGIEHEDQLRQLREEECDTGQGFLVSEPLPAEKLSQLLAAGADTLAVAPVASKPKRPAAPRRRKPAAASR